MSGVAEGCRSVALFQGQGLEPKEISAGEVRAALPALVERCCDLLGADPFAMARWSTDVAQPAVYVATLARWVNREPDRSPGALAGHSLGELTALAASGAMSHEDGLQLAVMRGRLTHEAVAGTDTGLLAIGVSVGDAEALAERFGLSVANDNSPRQVVLAGPRTALGEAARSAGTWSRMLSVPGAFHSEWVRPAVGAFSAEVERVRFRELSLPVWSSTTCAPIRHPRRTLVAALTSRVRWRELVLQLRAAGIAEFIDVGPGDTLSKLVARTLKDAAGRGAS
jgi:[acyl-carrier-protein] S-malonyltransferase